MGSGSAFEAFCASRAQEQQRAGHDVPSKLSHSFHYHQWREVARQKFLEAHLEESRDDDEVNRASKAAKTEASMAPPGPLTAHASPTLADAIAEQVVASLEQRGSSTAPASLRYAAQEAFPMPQEETNLPTFLLVAEAAMRITLWHSEDAPSAQLASRIRPQLQFFEGKGVIRLHPDHYPVLQLLMDLVSWRIITHGWVRLAPAMRATAVKGVRTLFGYVDSPAAVALSAMVQKLDIESDTTTVPLVLLDRLVADVSAAIPFQFAACRDISSLYPEPTGVLHLPGSVRFSGPPSASSPPSQQAAPMPAVSEEKNRGTSHNEENEREDADVRVGDLLAAEVPTPAPLETSGAIAPTTEVISSPPATVPTTVANPQLQLVPRFADDPAVAADPSPMEQPQRQRNTRNGHPACVSRYHDRYAEASKHASSECQYCATCHLMEVVFRGEKRDCVWKHWPTKRKIVFHLKRFPEVLALALHRFAEMENGVQLAATDAVPL